MPLDHRRAKAGPILKTAQVAQPVASILDKPDGCGRQVTQALLGEVVDVFEERDGWCHVQLRRDSYVGYMQARDLDHATAVATHRVSVPLALSFPEPDIKSQPAMALPLNAEVAAIGHDAKFLRLADGRYICRVHLQPAISFAADYVAIASQFIGVPYLWGGKSFMGLDCSGLVQLSLQACGIECPRDADMQEEELGVGIPKGADLRRGDLVFWKGHVGLLEDAQTLLHANGTHMRVVSEPLRVATSRIAAGGSPVTSIKRIQ